MIPHQITFTKQSKEARLFMDVNDTINWLRAYHFNAAAGMLLRKSAGAEREMDQQVKQQEKSMDSVAASSSLWAKQKPVTPPPSKGRFFELLRKFIGK